MLLQPNNSVDPMVAINDSVATIDALLLQPKNEMRDHQLKANADHLLMKAEELSLDESYIAKANEALAAL